MKQKFFISLSFLCSLFMQSGLNAFSRPIENLDKALLESLEKNQLNKFEKLLKEGANPNSIFGKKESDWVMCLANQKGRLDFLKLAVEYGGDINLRNRVKPVRTITSAPILCAITMHNNEAFDFLLGQGVNLSIHTYEEAQPIPSDSPMDPEFHGKTFYGSPLTRTFAPNEFCMSLKIIEKTDLNWEEKISLKRILEVSNVDPFSEKDNCRKKIINLLSQQGTSNIKP